MKHVASASSEDGTSDAIRFSNRRATIATSALYYTGPESKEWDLVGFEGWRLSNNLAKPEAHIVGDASGKNPLMIAIQNGTFGAIKFMLKTYNSLADRINKPDTFGRIPLLVACASDSLEVLQLLVEYGADVVNTRSSNGDTCLHESAGNESILSFLLARVPQSMVDTSTSNGVTPLECAIVKKSAACVKMLVDKGANQRSHSSNTKVPYVAAASTGDVKMIHHLSHKCLTPDEIQDALRESAKSMNGSACFKAIAQSTMCRLDVPNPSSHNLPLVWTAAIAGSLDIVRFLVEERGLGKDLAWLDEERRCIVLESARLGRSDLVQYLIAHGASPDIPDSDGRTVLHKIISSLAFLPSVEQLAQGLEMVQTIVLTSQIDPLRPNNSGFVNFGSSSEDFVVAPLKDRIAQERRLEFLDRVNADGESALHYAAKFGLLNITKFLVAAGASRKIKIGKRFIGKTPQELAASTGHTEVALFLGTKPDKGDKSDKSDKGDKGEKLMKPERSRAQTMAPGFTKVSFS
jgi:ankyrin repeat protein